MWLTDSVALSVPVAGMTAQARSLHVHHPQPHAHRDRYVVIDGFIGLSWGDGTCAIKRAELLEIRLVEFQPGNCVAN